MGRDVEFHFKPQGPVVSAYLQSRAQRAFIMGPVGSSKTNASCWRGFRVMTNQRPNREGVRHTRLLAVRNCFDDKTEILTELRGWQLFKDLEPTDKLAQLSDAGQLEFVAPTMHYQAPYVGEMLGFENEGVDFLVTPDHRLNVSVNRTRAKTWGEYEFKTATECFGKWGHRVKRNAVWAGVNPRGYSEAMFEWLGFWFAEGYAGKYQYPDRDEPHWRCTIVQTKDPAYVRDLFDRAGLPFTEVETGGTVHYKLRVSPATKPLIDELSRTGGATTKALPNWIKAAPPEHLRAFIDGYVRGDGSTNKCGVVTACTASIQLAGDMQELALRAGMVANITRKSVAGTAYAINGHHGVTTADFWCITFVRGAKHEPALAVGGYAGRYRGWYRQQYAGIVYCVEVPTHRVYVRRNGRAHWSSQTYGDLLGTTAKDWLSMFRHLGPFVQGAKEPPVQRLKFRLPDRTTVESEMIFLALDREEHVRKLRGYQLTAAMLSEAKEIPFAILAMLDLRIGRFPEAADGGCTWRGIFGDTNAPDTDHWYYKMAEEERPEGWEFFRQPGGLIRDTKESPWRVNYDAENLRNLPSESGEIGEYYLKGAQGKAEDWILVNLANEYGFVKDGKPVYPDYVDGTHCREFELVKELGIYIGLDFGLTPAALIGQRGLNGIWRFRHELTTTDTGTARFADELKRFLNTHYAGWVVHGIAGDPAGGQRQAGDVDESTTFQILHANDVYAVAAPGNNDIVLRTETFAEPMRKMIDGQPAFQLHPDCRMLRKGCAGGYAYHRVKVVGEERFRDMPNKNQYSHICDAGQYLVLGAGEGARVTSSVKADEARDYRGFREQMGYA